MKLAIFNIAWDKNQDYEIAKLLNTYGFAGVEVAPAKVWQSPINVSLYEAKSYKKFWLQNGLVISSLCSLFYPHQNLNFFRGKEDQNEMLTYFKRICILASWLGAEKLVFGSPQNRSYQNLDLEQVDEIAIDSFSRMAKIAQEYNLLVCLEPIPMQYGTNFINSTNEAIQLIKAVNSPFLRLHLDSGAMTLNQENLELVLAKALPFLEHVHISEDNLTEIGSGKVDHYLFARLLNIKRYSKWKVIEMRPTQQSDNIVQIKRSLEFVKKVYNNEKI